VKVADGYKENVKTLRTRYAEPRLPASRWWSGYLGRALVTCLTRV
jgi:hypothetical protein